MYVCLCKGVTDSQIRNAVDGGATNLRQVRKQLGVASQCGKCACLAKEIVSSAVEENQIDMGALCYPLA